MYRDEMKCKSFTKKETCQKCQGAFNMKVPINSFQVKNPSNRKLDRTCKKCRKKDRIENLLLKEFEKSELKSFINNVSSYIKDL